MTYVWLWAALIWLAVRPVQAANPSPQRAGSRLGPARVALIPDTQQVRRTVVDFLTWYKTHIQTANQIELVNQIAGKPYSVNLKNAERYLTYLKSSQLLTDTYLNGWRTFFRERQEGFRLSPQTEGPPTGFDYDLILLSQEVDLQLASLSSLKVKQVTIRKERASVTFVLLDTYEFRLVRGPNRWLINEILNLSQE